MKVTFLDKMGSDLTVVNAARCSFKKRSDWATFRDKDIYNCTESTFHLHENDEKLINYLAKHKHWTPFAHPQIQLHYKVPLFVARQIFKHTVGFTRNEVSRRYVDEDPQFYVPDVWRKRNPDKKQGSLDEPAKMIIDIDQYYKLIGQAYNNMIKFDVAPEMVRMLMPQAMYTEFYETGSLYAYINMVKLRTSPDAQAEVRSVAEEVRAIIKQNFPVSYAAWFPEDTVKLGEGVFPV